MAIRAILASKILKLPPDLLDGRAFPKEPCFFLSWPIHISSPCPDHKDEQHNSSDRPSTIIYAL